MVIAAFIDLFLIVSWDPADPYFCDSQHYTFQPVPECC